VGVVILLSFGDGLTAGLSIVWAAVPGNPEPARGSVSHENVLF